MALKFLASQPGCCSLKQALGQLRGASTYRIPDKGGSADLSSHTPNSNEASSIVSGAQFTHHQKGWEPVASQEPDAEQPFNKHIDDSLALSAPSGHVAPQSLTGHCHHPALCLALSRQMDTPREAALST